MSLFDPALPGGLPGNAVQTHANINLNIGDAGGTTQTYELARNNFDQVLMASTSLSASTAIAAINHNGRGIMAFMNITSAFPGSASTTYTLKIKAIQPNATASAVTICAAPPASVSGAYVLCLYPGAVKPTVSISGAANVAIFGGPCPRNFQVVASLSSGATSKEVVMSLGLTILL